MNSVFGRKKTDGRYRVEMNGGQYWLVSDDYEQACKWYEIMKNSDDKSILDVVLYDEFTPLASWCNSAALATL